MRLLDADPGLLDGLMPPAKEFLAGRAAPIFEVERGDWDAGVADALSRVAVGLLVVDGFLGCELQLGGETGMELLGPGDVIRPWTEVPLGPPDDRVRWRALEPCRLALLEPDFVNAAPRASALADLLLERATERAHRLMIQMTIAAFHPIDRRIHFMLWHLADHWGQRRNGDVIVPLPLTQQTLASLSGTERSTVSEALLTLRRHGLVERLPGKQWCLHGERPVSASSSVSLQARRSHAPAIA